MNIADAVLGYNFHPPLTAFPFAFLLSVLGLELGYYIFKKDILRVAARVNLVLAGFGVLAAFFSGYHASDVADQTFAVDNALISYHHLFGRLLLFVTPLCIALCFTSDKAKHGQIFFRTLYFASLLTCIGLVIQTGYLGGELVFKYGAGVRAQPDSNGEKK